MTAVGRPQHRRRGRLSSPPPTPQPIFTPIPFLTPTPLLPTLDPTRLAGLASALRQEIVPALEGRDLRRFTGWTAGPLRANQTVWSRQGDDLVVVAGEGSLWWAPEPGVGRVEQLTASLPEARQVRWSPGGTRLAFVSGTDFYVVTVRPGP